MNYTGAYVLSGREEILERIREKINRDPYANLLGIEVLEVKEGYSRASVTVKEEMVNFHGMAHGGLIASLADVAFAAASNSHNKKALALNLNISYRRPVKVGEALVAEAFEESLGDTTALYRIVVKNFKGVLVAVCQGLAYRIDEPVA
ncbi:MAG: hotdog fold thioesterase [Candidatus Nezhaarchaeota archaeon]|nr:hotdog fold thioesterase [Candidatus Nezhaarchaeota archaeon]